MKHLYFGDCLDVLKNLYTKNPNGFIDLIYIDPPFNSKRNYNILFEDIDMKDTKAQKQAFADTWSNITYKDSIEEIADLNINLFKFLKNLDEINISKSVIAYLATMAIRIHFMYKVLKDTGSFYLHCDTNMSHYLKLVCDLIFGKDNFRNDITWQRIYSHNDANKFGSIHDNIILYRKSNVFIWNKLYTKYDKKYLKMYLHDDGNGKLFKVEIKPYQIKQFLAIIEKYNLDLGENK
jgi:site-specific DNA-methyltransferase (adenine-specific)